MNVNIYVLRRDLLTPGYDYNTILAMDEDQLAHEMNLQLDRCVADTGKEDSFIAIYSPEDFEDAFNLENDSTSDNSTLDINKYYIRIIYG